MDAFRDSGPWMDALLKSKKPGATELLRWSGRQDSNLRPLRPERSDIKQYVSFMSLGVTKDPPKATERHPNKDSPEKKKNPEKSRFLLEPTGGFEPPTYSLRVSCSTPELHRQWPNYSTGLKLPTRPRWGLPIHRPTDRLDRNEELA